MARTRTFNAGFPVTTTAFAVEAGAALSDAHDLAGEGVAGFWIGPTAMTTITPLHAPPADDEPAAADFEPYYHVAVGGTAAAAVSIPLPAAAETERVYVQLEAGILWRCHWLALQGDENAAVGGETIEVDAVSLVSP